MFHLYSSAISGEKYEASNGIVLESWTLVNVNLAKKATSIVIGIKSYNYIDTTETYIHMRTIEHTKRRLFPDNQQIRPMIFWHPIESSWFTSSESSQIGIIGKPFSIHLAFYVWHHQSRRNFRNDHTCFWNTLIDIHERWEMNECL